MRGEADVFALERRDGAAVHSGGTGAAERVVRRDSKEECAAGILHVNDEARRCVLDYLWRVYVRFPTVKGDRVVIELQGEAGGGSILASHTEPCNHCWRTLPRNRSALEIHCRISAPECLGTALHVLMDFLSYS